jgi:FMN reductase
LKIAGFSGSVSANSNTYKGVKNVLDICQQKGAEVVLYNLRKNPLPFYDPDYSDANVDDNVMLFSKLLTEADGIVLGSPEYHNTLGGAFKNALDWVGARQFKNKPVALISATGGPSSMATLTAMQLMIRSLHGWIVPVLGSIPGDTEFYPDGTFKEVKMQKRFESIAAELVSMAELLKHRQ